MKKAKLIGALIAVLITSPIWFFILYRILETTNQSELVWFLYWVYVPFTLLALVLLRLGED